VARRADDEGSRMDRLVAWVLQHGTVSH
jgi:hypothetical protein